VKKIALISVLAIYLVLNLGISIKIHYCGDAISFIDLFPVNIEKNCCGGEKPACCKDKIAFVNPQTIQDNIQVAHFSFPDYAKFNLIIQDFSLLSVLESQNTEVNIFTPHRESLHHKVPLYLRHQVFRL
jgi:hypothetical protein